MENISRRGLRAFRSAALLTAVLSCGSASAWYDDGKVLLTGGVVTIDGAGGGGITPWATISGYGTRDGVNGGVHYTFAYLPDYSLNSYGLTFGFWDRLELSYTNSALPTGSTFDTVGLVNSILGDSLDLGIEPWNTTIKMDIYGAKLRLFGDAVYNSHSLIPQVAIGGFYKENKNAALLDTLQANKAKDWEAYVVATKILFPISTLFSVTGRYTAANQTGLTGFGGPDGDKKEMRLEVSIAHLLSKNTAIGFEYAQHGDNLDGKSVKLGALDVSGITQLLQGLPGIGGLVNVGGLGDALTQKKESDWYDLFFAYAPNKNLSFTVAYAMLGNITLTPNQSGLYLSMHATF